MTEYILIMLIATGSLDSFSVLQYVTFCSYVKLGVTFVKYVPQAWFNFVRKSTVGWAIWNVLLDLTGGLLSLLQQFLEVLNSGSWTVFTGNWAKTGLALFSIFFDVLFIIQHYVLYPTRADPARPRLSHSDHSEEEIQDLPKSSDTFPYLSINLAED
ncbi:MAG: PQ-loop domain-containing transporter [archaeon]|nr:PQ-loop domain-containing transporter [archaeon]